MPRNVNLLSAAIVSYTPSLIRGTRSCQLQIEIQGDERRKRLRPKHIHDVIPRTLVPFRREQRRFFSLARLLQNKEFDARLYTSILAQQARHPRSRG